MNKPRYLNDYVVKDNSVNVTIQDQFGFHPTGSTTSALVTA